jgi:hypothetical protein
MMDGVDELYEGVAVETLHKVAHSLHTSASYQAFTLELINEHRAAKSEEAPIWASAE